jgi:uncharacterized protein (TIGR03032 family)
MHFRRKCALQQASASITPHRRPDESDDSADPAAIPAWTNRGYDYSYIPRVGYTTGHLDIHDVALGANDLPVFVNTMFGCLATLSEHGNFRPLWRPPFISELVPEDRCHMNGLAMWDGCPAFVTVVAKSNVAGGWREQRRDGGCVLDVASGETVVSGLSMPHSPRWHDGRLWVLNSGSGEFGQVDLDRGVFEPIVFCPGYLRGMAFIGNYAVVTLSKPRSDTFQGLKLDERLEHAGKSPDCGLQIINLNSGSVEHSLIIEGTLVAELYDSIVLSGVRQPMAVGFQSDEIERMMLIDDSR